MTELDAMIEKFFGTMSPHVQKLGCQLVSVASGVCIAKVPYRADLVGDPLSGVLHGGVVTSLLDTTGGAAVFSAIGTPMPIATLDLRIDYLRPSRPGQTLFARVECFKKTSDVAFTRGIAHDGDERDPVASMAATYMLRTQTKRAPEAPR